VASATKSKPQGEIVKSEDQLPEKYAGAFGGAERAIVKGRGNEAATNLSRVAMYQGTAEEEAKYGSDFKRGEFIDTLEIRSLGPVIRIVPVAFKAQYAVWVKGQNTPVQSWDDASQVPPELLEWSGEGNTRTPPQAQESVSAIVCVQGEPWPYAMTFKKTSLKAFNQRIQPMEARRAATGQPPGLYELSSIDDKNPDGQPYKRLVAKYVGTPPIELLDLALKVYQSASEFQRRAAAVPE
jgi:hypothetical protein